MHWWDTMSQREAPGPFEAASTGIWPLLNRADKQETATATVNRFEVHCSWGPSASYNASSTAKFLPSVPIRFCLHREKSWPMERGVFPGTREMDGYGLESLS